MLSLSSLSCQGRTGGLPHTSAYSLGNGTRADLKGCTLQGKSGSSRPKATGKVGQAADSRCLETVTRAISTSCPGLKPTGTLDSVRSLSSYNLFHLTGYLSTNMAKAPGGLERGWGIGAGNWGATAIAPHTLSKSRSKHCHVRKQKQEQKNLQKNPLGDLLSSFVQAREAPVNDKATEKHHWPGPGTTGGQGMWHPRGSPLVLHLTHTHSRSSS